MHYQPPPLLQMIVPRQADSDLVTTQIVTVVVPHLLLRSGGVSRLEIRPWMIKGEPPTKLASIMIWLKVPDTTPKQATHGKISAHKTGLQA